MDTISFENELVTNLVLVFPVHDKSTKIKSVLLSTVTVKSTLFKKYFAIILLYFALKIFICDFEK